MFLVKTGALQEEFRDASLSGNGCCGSSQWVRLQIPIMAVQLCINTASEHLNIVQQRLTRLIVWTRVLVLVPLMPCYWLVMIATCSNLSDGDESSSCASSLESEKKSTDSYTDCPECWYRDETNHESDMGYIGSK